MFRTIKYFFRTFRIIRPLNVTFDSGGGRKPTIVLLHGIAASSKTWNPLIKELDVKKYRIIAIDLLGFGSSIKPENCDYTIDDHVMYVRKTLKKLNVNEPFKIIGHSMGAMIAAHYGFLFPSEVKELILLSPPIYTNNSNINIVARKRTDFYMKAYDFILKNKDFTINNSQFLRKLLRIDDGIDVNHDNWNSFKKSLKNTIINQDVFSEIEAIAKPTRIIYGAMDEFLVSESINLLSSHGHIKITKLNGVNHLLGSRYSKVVAKEVS